MSIPKPLRSKVWNIHIGELISIAKCMCCQHEVISQSNWHCGHIISRKNGGETTERNLRPVCAGCNTSMNDTNMLDYMRKFGYDTKNILESCHKKSLIYETNNSASKLYSSMEIHIMNGMQIMELWKNVQFWEFNRPVDEDRAKLMVGKVDFLLTPITICKITDQYFLIDGQHRYRSWILSGQPLDTEWLIHIITCEHESVILKLFEVVNSGTPVPAAYYNKRIERLIEDYLRLVVNKWPDAESKSDLPIRPRFNRRTIKDLISNNVSFVKLLMSGVEISAKIMFDKTFEYNETIKLKINTGLLTIDSEKCLSVAKKIDFFIGLEGRDWPSRIASIVVDSIQI